MLKTLLDIHVQYIWYVYIQYIWYVYILEFGKTLPMGLFFICLRGTYTYYYVEGIFIDTRCT